MNKRLVWILSLILLVGSPALGIGAQIGVEENCRECHLPGASKSKLHVDPKELAASVHSGKVACVDCHPGSVDKAHMERTLSAPVPCRDCHDVNTDHGRGAGKPAVCADCHGGHNIFRADDARSTLHPDKIAAACGRCHPAEAGVGDVTAAFRSFRVKAHGKADLGKSYSRRRCLDCHRQEASHSGNREGGPGECATCHNRSAGPSPALGSFHGAISRSEGPPTGAAGDWVYLGCCVFFLIVFSWAWAVRARIWAVGKPDYRWDKPLQRLVGWLGPVLGQRRVFRRRLAGIGHCLIFAGVALPLMFIVAAQFGPAWGAAATGAASLALDVAGIGTLAGLGISLARRIKRPDEFPAGVYEGAWPLIILFAVVATGFLIEGLRLAAVPDNRPWSHPVGTALAAVLPASPDSTAGMWRIHFLLVLVFLAAIPLTRMKHLATAPLNVFFRNLGPTGRLAPVEVSSGTQFGVTRAEDLTWKDLLDADSCVSCGRCREACPAFLTEKPLSPMKVLGEIRSCAEAARGGIPSDPGGAILLEDRIADEEIWSCTTCHACENACPFFVEHVPKLMGLRRGLVMDRGAAPPEAARVLRNLETFGDPMGAGRSLRREWARPLPTGSLGFPAEGSPLLWVGCLGAFHPRIRDVALALAAVSRRAQAGLTILGEEELCCGDPARRLGQEALFQEIARKNVETFRAWGVSEIVALCPHCYNTLKNEYPDFGAKLTVRSSAEWLDSLIDSGKLRVRNAYSVKATYHDPCYLGRINSEVEPPRNILRAIRGLDVVEMSRSRDQTLCCGAGGGHLWLREPGKRISSLRAGLCIETRADLVAAACPYCLIMLDDGIRTMHTNSAVAVMDLAEIVELVTRGPLDGGQDACPTRR